MTIKMLCVMKSGALNESQVMSDSLSLVENVTDIKNKIDEKNGHLFDSCQILFHEV